MNAICGTESFARLLKIRLRVVAGVKTAIVNSSTVLIALGSATSMAVAAPGETDLVSRGNTALEVIETGPALTGISFNFTSQSESPDRNVSRDGDLVVFASKSRLSGYSQFDRNYEALSQVFLHQRSTGKTILLSQNEAGVPANSAAHNPSMSSDGRFVVYASRATNLADLSRASTKSNIFVLDRQTGQTDVVDSSVDHPDSPYAVVPLVSADGNIIVYAARNDEFINRTNIYAFDRRTRTLQLVSRSMTGGNPADEAINPALSANGRYVAYASKADDIVANDTNVRSDIFVFDLQSETTERVSVDQWGFHGILDSYAPSISADGRFVAFQSNARNLVRNDTNNATDIIVYDRETNRPTRVSTGSTGAQSNADSTHPAISEDGRYVAFLSSATNLSPQDLNARDDVYVHDRSTGTTALISTSATGDVAASESRDVGINADGRFVSYHSNSQNLVENDAIDSNKLFVHEQQNSQNYIASVYSNDIQIPARIPGDGASTTARISEDGSVVVFISASENMVQADRRLASPALFEIDTQTGITRQISDDWERLGGASFEPEISPDGRYVAFVSGNIQNGSGYDIHEVLLHDRDTGLSTSASRISDGTVIESCQSGSISRDGKFVAMWRCYDGVLRGDDNGQPDVVVYDADRAAHSIISRNSSGELGNHASERPRLSSDGRYVVFLSYASNLDSRINNTNNKHVYVHDRDTGTTELVSVSTGGLASNGFQLGADISDDGRYVVFDSYASNLVPGLDQAPRLYRVYLHDRQTGTTSMICRTPGNEIADGYCTNPRISSDGNRIVFESGATDLVDDDQNGVIRDIFVYDRSLGRTEKVNIASDGSQPLSESRSSVISDDGRFVAFESVDTGLDPADIWSVSDIFVHELDFGGAGGTGYFSLQSTTVDENASRASIQITLDPISTAASSVKFATRSQTATAGSDFFGKFVELDFPAGTATRTVDIEILDDTVVEGDESFDVRLFDATGDTGIEAGLGSVTILDNDSPGQQPIYSDVPGSHFAFEEIQRFHASGIAGRCAEAPLRFCPDNFLRRDVMTLWLGRGKYGANYPRPEAGGDRFTDVPATFWAAGWMELADRDRVYRGCGDFSTACPSASMTRAQLAVYTVKARYGANYDLPPATGHFDDIPASHWAARHIEQLVRDGVIDGSCAASGTRFCPSGVASRADAAIWIVRAFGL